MHARLSAALDALDAHGRDAIVFVRDDDAGWGHDALLALLDVTLMARVPIDLAAIPATLDGRIVNELNERIDVAPSLVAVHQHGWSHTNHESEGRRCEFGPSRSAALQRDDLERGRTALAEAFGDRVDPIFTPPWNRCTEQTGLVLADLGFKTLSRDSRATPATVMPELPVHVDWSRAWREQGRDGVADAIATALEACATLCTPLGLMLHHAAMEHDERVCLGRWLRVLREHPRVQCKLMRECVGARTQQQSPCSVSSEHHTFVRGAS